MRKIKKLRSLKPSARRMRECSRVKQNKRVSINCVPKDTFLLSRFWTRSFPRLFSPCHFHPKLPEQMYFTNALKIQKFVCFFYEDGTFLYTGSWWKWGGGTKGINVYFFLPKLLFLVMGHLWVDLKDKWHFEYNQG